MDTLDCLFRDWLQAPRHDWPSPSHQRSFVSDRGGWGLAHLFFFLSDEAPQFAVEEQHYSLASKNSCLAGAPVETESFATFLKRRKSLLRVWYISAAISKGAIVLLFFFLLQVWGHEGEKVEVEERLIRIFRDKRGFTALGVFLFSFSIILALAFHPPPPEDGLENSPLPVASNRWMTVGVLVGRLLTPWLDEVLVLMTEQVRGRFLSGELAFHGRGEDWIGQDDFLLCF
jgi:hypothetical protein